MLVDGDRVDAIDKVDTVDGRGGALVATMLLAIVACRAAPADPGARPEPHPTAAHEECGRTPLPPCPLQRWMGTQLAPALRSGRLDRIAAPLEELAGLAPRQYAGWASIALAGAKAARAGDWAGVRQSCGSCHDSYRDRYRDEMRDRPLAAAGSGEVARW